MAPAQFGRDPECSVEVSRSLPSTDAHYSASELVTRQSDEIPH